MTDLERIKKDVVEMDSRANVCWYDTKVLTKAVRLILERDLPIPDPELVLYTNGTSLVK